MSASDVTRTEPRGISDSDSELPVVGKKSLVPQKTSRHPLNCRLPQLASNQDSRELAEMRSAFKEKKGLTEHSAVYVELIAKIEQARLDAVNNLPVVPTAELEGI